MRWLAVILLLSAADGGSNTGTVEVEITGHANTGTLWLTLHNDPDAFPKKAEKAVQRAKVKVRAGPFIHKFENVPFGEYAVSVVHDENDNGKIDTGLFGIPLEGYGVSNNSKGFAAFNYDAAKFKVDRALVKQSIVMRR